jgi:platelet-activating factor acetylhydrolase
MASHGMVVIAPDHRDGSAPISFVRNSDGSFREIAEYKNIPHRSGQDVEDARNEQLRIRLWELGLLHEALLKIDRAEPLTNLVSPQESKNPPSGGLAMFGSSFDIHTPGRITWSGHSFGAVTAIQFVKSVFYHGDRPNIPPSQPLYDPAEHSPITAQITPSSPLIIFDLWSPPLRTKATEWLWKKPLPCYTTATRDVSNVLLILSEAFYKWRANLSLLKKAVSPEYALGKEKATKLPPPHIFYPVTSTHMGQSDFGVLSPKLTQKVFKSDDPVRDMCLNIRAALEMLRRNGYELADTTLLDMEAEANGHVLPSPEQEHVLKGRDPKILATDGSIKGWIMLPAAEDLAEKSDAGSNADISDKAAPSEAVIKEEVLKELRPTNGMARRVSSMTEWNLPPSLGKE